MVQPTNQPEQATDDPTAEGRSAAGEWPAAEEPPADPPCGYDAASSRLPEHVRENRRYWDSMADEWVSAGERNWANDDPDWGIWGFPESTLKLLPEDMHGMDAIELGCGTAYVSAWMARRGAKVVGIDNSTAQLRTAARLMAEHGLEISLIHGNAERVPLPGDSFDFAISEYGAAIWCDPSAWIPEAHRLLRSGGTLVFMGTHPLVVLCSPDDGKACDTRLHRPYRTVDRSDWRHVPVDPGGIEFNLPVSGWLELFRRTGFKVLDYRELIAPDDVADDRFCIPAEWATRWPSEQVWVLQKA